MENARILIIDDDVDLSSALQAILESKQYAVSLAASKEEGMEKIKSDKPDMIILDVMMDTWQDGFDLARELKGNNEYANIPILMLTGIEDKTGIEFKSEAGDPDWLPVDGFLDKPVDTKVLLDEVQKILSK